MIQEDDWIASRSDLPDADGFDLLLWTRTWAIPKERAESQLGPWRGKIVGYHLDRWWGLNHPEDRFPRGRQNAVYTDPYFRWLDWWFTADPQTALWEAAGVRAVWTPPAVSTRWTFDAEPAPDKYPFDIVFVGHVDGYHPEDQARRIMLDVLASRYRGRFRLLGNTHPRIVPAELNVLYASVPVIVGSSVFAGLDSYWCADEETEILTNDGWKSHLDVLVGDVAYTLNTDTMLGEWQTIEKVARFDVEDEPMWSMETRAHSSLTTLGHRWFVKRATSERINRVTALECEVCEWASTANDQLWGLALHRRKMHDLATSVEKQAVSVPAWRTSRDLHGADRIPVAAPCSTLPLEAKWADAFVELAAWAWTEGDVNAGRYRGIVQSHRINPSYCDRIRACLTSLYGPTVENMRKVQRGTPAWKEYQHGNGMTRFSINRMISDLLWEVTPDHRPEPWFISQLTAAQLHLFVETSVDADGCRKTSSKSGSVSTGTTLYQQDAKRLDGFEMACALLGRATSRSHQEDGILVHSKTRTWTAPMRSDLPLGMRGIVEYSGIIWCPTTPNGTWLARRNGTMYFTGNSDRLPETLGRGGFLIHPDTYWRGQFTPGVHLECFRPGDWDGLCDLIDACLEDPDRRGRVAAQGAHRVRRHHTYTARMEAMLETVL